jgi:hypothetical protein
MGREMTLRGTHMRLFYIGSFALILLLAWPSNSFADGIAISNASLDWTGFTFTVTSGLTVSVVDAGDFAFSFASTTLGEPSSAQGSNASAFSQYSTSTANGVAQAATANGFVATSSQASTTSLQPSSNFAESSVFIERDFFLYGSGVGTLTVSIPFTLSVACSSQPLGSPAVDLTTAADASVFLEIGPGNLGLPASDTISCQNNPGVTNGVLTVSENFTNPTFGPLVSIDARASTDAEAKVPEPSGLLLLSIGLTGLAGTLLRKRFV